MVQFNSLRESISSENNNNFDLNPPKSQKTGQNSNNWQKLRERRLRFYKAYRKMQNMYENGRTVNSTKNSATASDSISIPVRGHRSKKNEESFLDPTNITFNDWETFITDYSKVLPQLNRRKASFNEHDISGITDDFHKDLSRGRYWPPISMQSSPAVRFSVDSRQLLSNLPPESNDHLPLPPNPRSTEASVHTVEAYAPIMQYHERKSNQNNFLPHVNYNHKYANEYGRTDAAELVPQPSLNSYSGDVTYMTDTDNDCIDSLCDISQTNPFSSSEDERCNSLHLKQIISQNIVRRDAEASKRSIYAACEMELEVPCNVICGTGFYSYVVKATQFCLASIMDVNCYVFIPSCDFHANLIRKRRMKKL